MKTLFKRVTSVLLALAIISTATISSFAQINTDGNVRKNITFEEGSIEELLDPSSTNGIASRKASDNSKKLVYMDCQHFFRQLF